jgi:hypothetical protein
MDTGGLGVPSLNSLCFNEDITSFNLHQYLGVDDGQRSLVDMDLMKRIHLSGERQLLMGSCVGFVNMSHDALHRNVHCSSNIQEDSAVN